MSYKAMVKITSLSDNLMESHKDDLDGHQKWFEGYIQGIYKSEKITTKEMNLAKAYIISKCCNYGR